MAAAAGEDGMSYESALSAAQVEAYRRDGFVHLDCGPTRRW